MARALGQAVPVAAVGARDVVVALQRRAHADGDRLLAAVEVGEPGHPGRRVELVDVLLEDADRRASARTGRSQVDLAVPALGAASAGGRGQARELREHVEDDGEVVLVEAHARARP